MLVSAIHQHESAIGIHMSPPSWTSLPPQPHPSRLSQISQLSSLHHRANSPWLSIWHMVMYMFNAVFSICFTLLFPRCSPCDRTAKTIEIYFSQFWKLENPRSRCWLICSLRKALFLTCLLTMSLHGFSFMHMQSFSLSCLYLLKGTLCSSNGNSERFYFLGLQNHCRGDCSCGIKRHLLLGRNKPRQHIKKQRHYFANKGPYSPSYGFSSSHVWMWELYYKES